MSKQEKLAELADVVAEKIAEHVCSFGGHGDHSDHKHESEALRELPETTEAGTVLNDQVKVDVIVNGLRPHSEDIWEIPIYWHLQEPNIVDDFAYEEPEEFLLASAMNSVLFERSEFKPNQVYKFYSEEEAVPPINNEFKTLIKENTARARPPAQYPQYQDGKHYCQVKLQKEDLDSLYEQVNKLYAGKVIKGYENAIASVKNDMWDADDETKAMLDYTNLEADTRLRCVPGPDADVTLSPHFINGADLDTISAGGAQLGLPDCNFCSMRGNDTYYYEQNRHPFAIGQRTDPAAKYAASREDCFVKNYTIGEGAVDAEFSDTLKFRDGVAIYSTKMEEGVERTKANMKARIATLRDVKNKTFTAETITVVDENTITILASDLNKHVVPSSLRSAGHPSVIELTDGVDSSGNTIPLGGQWNVSGSHSFFTGSDAAPVTLVKDAHGVTVDPLDTSIATSVTAKVISGAVVPSSFIPTRNVGHNFSTMRNPNAPKGIHVMVYSIWFGSNASSLVPQEFNLWYDQEQVDRQRQVISHATSLWCPDYVPMSYHPLPVGYVLIHELGHHFGLHHNQDENGAGNWYKGRAETNYLNGNNYIEMEQFLSGGSKGDWSHFDSIFDTPMDTNLPLPGGGGFSESYMWTPNKAYAERFNSMWPNSKGALETAYKWVDIFKNAPQKELWFTTRSGFQIAPGANLVMTYNGFLTRLYFSRDQAKSMRNCIAWIYPGYVSVADSDIAESSVYWQDYVDNVPRMEIQRPVQVQRLKTLSVDAAHVSTTKNVGKHLEYNYVRVLDQIESQRTYSNVAYAQKQFIGQWELVKNDSGYLEMSPALNYLTSKSGEEYIQSDPSNRKIHLDNVGRSDLVQVKAADTSKVGFPSWKFTQADKLDMHFTSSSTKVSIGMKNTTTINRMFEDVEDVSFVSDSSGTGVFAGTFSGVMAANSVSEWPIKNDISRVGQWANVVLEPYSATATNFIWDTNSIYNGNIADVQNDRIGFKNSGEWDINFKITKNLVQDVSGVPFDYYNVELKNDDKIPYVSPEGLSYKWTQAGQNAGGGTAGDYWTINDKNTYVSLNAGWTTANFVAFGFLEQAPANYLETEGDVVYVFVWTAAADGASYVVPGFPLTQEAMDYWNSANPLYTAPFFVGAGYLIKKTIDQYSNPLSKNMLKFTTTETVPYLNKNDSISITSNYAEIAGEYIVETVAGDDNVWTLAKTVDHNMTADSSGITTIVNPDPSSPLGTFTLTSTADWGSINETSDYGSGPGVVSLIQILRSGEMYSALSGAAPPATFASFTTGNFIGLSTGMYRGIQEEDHFGDSKYSNIEQRTSAWWGPNSEKALALSVEPSIYHSVQLIGAPERANYPGKVVNLVDSQNPFANISPDIFPVTDGIQDIPAGSTDIKQHSTTLICATGNAHIMTASKLKELHLATDNAPEDTVINTPSEDQMLITLGKPNYFVPGSGKSLPDPVPIQNGQIESVTVSFPSRTRVEGILYYSTEPGFDYVYVYADGIEVFKGSGHPDDNTNDYNSYSFAVDCTNLEIKYQKDGSWWAGYDMCYFTLTNVQYSSSIVAADGTLPATASFVVAAKVSDTDIRELGTFELTGQDSSNLAINETLVNAKHSIIAYTKGDWLKAGNEFMVKLDNTELVPQTTIEA